MSAANAGGDDDATSAAASLPATHDPRVLLGVSATATAEEIKLAFRRLALQHHPDKGGSSAEFQRIHAAAEALGAAGGGERPCVAPRATANAQQQQQEDVEPLPVPSAAALGHEAARGWRLAEGTNSMGYPYLCVVHTHDGPCLALHRESLGGAKNATF